MKSTLPIALSLVLLFCFHANAQAQTSATVRSTVTVNHNEVDVLFDGTNLDKWRGYKQEKIGKGWKVNDGVLEFDGSGGGDICTRDAYTDFELSLEWKVTEGANSGIMYRVRMGDGAPYLSGPEYQILDDSKHRDGKNKTTSAAALYALYECKNKELKKVGEWNTCKIVHVGNKVEHWLNGKKVVSAEIGSEDWNKRIAASKFKNWKQFGKNAKGHIALQDHGNKVWFRNIKIKKLDKTEK